MMGYRPCPDIGPGMWAKPVANHSLVFKEADMMLTLAFGRADGQGPAIYGSASAAHDVAITVDSLAYAEQNLLNLWRGDSTVFAFDTMEGQIEDLLG